jgi:tagatose 6-phosphate kinase
MARCLTITLNASVDQTYLLDRLRLGSLTRARCKRAMAGGKGNNVARVLGTLGQEVTATGLLGGEPGRFIDRELRAAGIATAFTWIAGDSRSCLTFIEQETGTVTEVLEPGPIITPIEAEALLRALPALVADAAFVVVCGSLPTGLPAGFFPELLRIARASGAFLAVDTSGDALRQAVGSGADLITPNAAELAALSDGPSDPDALIAYAHTQIAGATTQWPPTVLLSLGKDGAALISQHGIHHAAPPPDLPIVNTVGCGDALLAGFIVARARGEPNCDALAAGVATGSAAALEEVAGVVAPAHVARLRARITARPWRQACGHDREED